MSKFSRKNRRLKKQRSKKMAKMWRATLCIIVLFGLLFGIQKCKPQNNSWYGNVHNLEERYHYLLSHVTTNTVHPLLRPVHFTIGNRFSAGGTLVLKKDQFPAYIITASHLFSATQPGSDYYDYHVLCNKGFSSEGHVSRVAVDQFHAVDNSNIISDIAICQIGDPGLISRTSKVQISGQVAFTEASQVNKTEDAVMLTYVITGEKYPIIGQMTSAGGAYWIMLYDSLPGESGNGFWGTDSNLYVLSGSFALTRALRKQLGIALDYKGKRLTLVSGTHIVW